MARGPRADRTRALWVVSPTKEPSWCRRRVPEHPRRPLSPGQVLSVPSGERLVQGHARVEKGPAPERKSDGEEPDRLGARGRSRRPIGTVPALGQPVRLVGGIRGPDGSTAQGRDRPAGFRQAESGRRKSPEHPQRHQLLRVRERPRPQAKTERRQRRGRRFVLGLQLRDHEVPVNVRVRDAARTPLVLYATVVESSINGPCKSHECNGPKTSHTDHDTVTTGKQVYVENSESP
mmetsp:Transcript_3694/g.9670  ORF Transcript_3694/g.9670 Transcript_3694/m.9670 type:complete len:234 (+) Transcript_3694:1199-1900(+)